MPHKDLNNIPHLDLIALFLIGIWGAIMNYTRRVTKEYSLIKKVLLFFLDAFTSGGIAVFSYLIIVGYLDNIYLAVGISGVLAHQGTRSFYILEQVITQKLGVKL